MKYLYVLTLLSFISFSTIAQTKNERAVANAVEKLRIAMIDGNRAGLENAAWEGLSYGHSSGMVESKTEFVEHIASGKSDFVTIDISEQTITISHNVAIVRHTFNATTNDGGKPGTVKLKILYVFEKDKGEWKMLARQAVKFI
jgi:hypothetical protein